MALKDYFCKGVQGWDNHRPLLWLALEATKGDILELGMGNGSTPFLHVYSEQNRRFLRSCDYVGEWVEKFKALRGEFHRVMHVPDWDSLYLHPDVYSVVLVDHSPGERRWVDIQKLEESKLAEIIVIHDTEPEATGYMLEKIWPLFKYRVDLKSPGAGAMSSAVSNTFDVRPWAGTLSGGGQEFQITDASPR